MTGYDVSFDVAIFPSFIVAVQINSWQFPAPVGGTCAQPVPGSARNHCRGAGGAQLPPFSWVLLEPLGGTLGQNKLQGISSDCCSSICCRLQNGLCAPARRLFRGFGATTVTSGSPSVAADRSRLRHHRHHYSMLRHPLVRCSHRFRCCRSKRSHRFRCFGSAAVQAAHHRALHDVLRDRCQQKAPDQKSPFSAASR